MSNPELINESQPDRVSLSLAALNLCMQVQNICKTKARLLSDWSRDGVVAFGMTIGSYDS